MEMQMNFNQELQQNINKIEEIIKQFLPKEEGFQKTVIEAMNYSMLAGGKRLRPMLMEESYLLFGGKEYKLLEPFMAAIEMIHTYSLVHDDLPAMDNDEYRRGRKTTHVVYGEAMGILAGDGLLNYAFETAMKTFQVVNHLEEAQQLTTYQRIAKALQVLGDKAGINGMIGGQVIDMEGFEGINDRNRLDQMYRLKTGALIEASMMIGAILAGAKEEYIVQIEGIAGDIGLAFQIRDDILDVTSTQEKLGKPIHSDEKNDKLTYVMLMDLEHANQEVVEVSNRAMMAFEALPYQNEFLKALIIKLINREN
jgi:geranylgeranyl diphosphate synthase type II